MSNKSHAAKNKLYYAILLPIEIIEIFGEAHHTLGNRGDRRCAACGGIIQHGECGECGRVIPNKRR